MSIPFPFFVWGCQTPGYNPYRWPPSCRVPMTWTSTFALLVRSPSKGPAGGDGLSSGVLMSFMDGLKQNMTHGFYGKQNKNQFLMLFHQLVSLSFMDVFCFVSGERSEGSLIFFWQSNAQLWPRPDLNGLQGEILGDSRHAQILPCGILDRVKISPVENRRWFW